MFSPLLRPECDNESCAAEAQDVHKQARGLEDGLIIFVPIVLYISSFSMIISYFFSQQKVALVALDKSVFFGAQKKCFCALVDFMKTNDENILRIMF